jgi:hypothetical protein
MRCRLTLLALAGLLLFAVDAHAFFRHRLLHGYGSHHQVVPMGSPFLQQLLGTTLGTTPGTSAPPTITVSSDVVANIKQTEKNLQDASAILKPLAAKYKLANLTTDTSGNVTHIGGVHVDTLTQDDIDAILKKLGKK